MHVLLQGSRVPRCCGRSFNSLARPQEVAATVPDDTRKLVPGQQHAVDAIKNTYKLIITLALHEHLLRLVDFCGEEGRAPEVGVVDPRHAAMRVLDPFRGRGLTDAQN